MKKNSPSSWKTALEDSISTVKDHKDIHFENPETDFSRTQKITLRDTMLFPMVADNENTSTELLDFFQTDALPSPAAMLYRRDQLKVSAFEAVFYDFTKKIPQKKNFHGMKVIACDGTRVNTPYNPKDRDSFVNCINGRKGYNQYHVTTFYDVLNEIFTDTVIQNYPSMNESLAFCTMLERYPGEKKSLFVADRGFASYNTIAHAMNSGHMFLFRLPVNMARTILRDTQDIDNASILDAEDVLRIGRVRNNESRLMQNYHFMRSDRQYDYIPVASKKIDCFRVRLVKFQLPGGDNEYLLTNLPKNKYSLKDLKELYRIRWGVETSFRHLKYASGLVHMHSVKQKFIFQEIFAKLTLYNFCAAVNCCAKAKNSEGLKYEYQIEKTYLVKVCIRFLKDMLTDIISLIERKRVPVRPGRKFKRNIRRQHADTLQYR